MMMQMDPTAEAIFGLLNLSTSIPTKGAMSAYTPPFIMNISPIMTALRSNCLKCGSSVALMKPIDADVAQMPNVQTKTPGIFNTCNIDP